MGNFDTAEQVGNGAARRSPEVRAAAVTDSIPQSHPEGSGGLGGFVTDLWHKGGDMAKHIAQQAKPVAGQALEAGKTAVHKADEVATKTGLKKDVTDAATGTVNKYKNEGLGVAGDFKRGDYVHGALKASKLAATAAAGPAAVVLDAGSQVADKQAGRHLSAQQAQEVHGALGVVRKGAEIAHGGVPSVTGIVTEQARKTAVDRAASAVETPSTVNKVNDLGHRAVGAVTGLFHHTQSSEKPEEKHVKQ